MLTSAQVVETSVNVTSNSPSQDYTHPDDHNLPNYVVCFPDRNLQVIRVCFSFRLVNHLLNDQNEKPELGDWRTKEQTRVFPHLEEERFDTRLGG